MKKKLLLGFVVLALVLSMSTAVFAEDQPKCTAPPPFGHCLIP